MISGNIAVVEGDITHLQVDAIVNAVNPSLLGGGYVDGTIRQSYDYYIAALKEIFREEGQG
jgi:O-acetyl-ADP-ribose deacetylase (regulator of RNase III)